MLGIRTEIDRLVVDLATRLATARCETLETAIAEGLAGAATALGLDRAFLWQEELTSIPSVASKLEAGEGFSYTRVDEISDATARASLLRSGLYSAAFVPVATAATPAGSRALVLGSETPTQWPADLLAQMRLMAGVFGQALARASTANALQHALGELRELRVERIDSLPPARARHGSHPRSKCRDVQRAMAQVELVASMPSTVLLLGETGVGKEVFADAIHALSPRHKREMIRVNCSAIPSGLIESELFGRERGAYTGATTRQIGRFEAANQSTLFLDEIGELSPEMQVKLLRVLESRVIERLGSTKSIAIDVRIIAATNRHLESAVHEGTFRADLFYRLNVFPIALPPLRRRVEDIPVLAWQFIDEFSEKCGKRIDALSRRSLDELLRYSWPGNIRELRNVIERSVIRTTGTTLVLSMPDAATDPLPRDVLAAGHEREVAAAPHLRIVEG